MDAGSGADPGGERPLAARRRTSRRIFAFLPVILAFAFLLTVLINLAHSNGDLVRQTNAPCPQHIDTASGSSQPSLACQVQQLKDLLAALNLEPVPGQPGQVRVIVPSPYLLVVPVEPAPAPQSSNSNNQPASPAPEATPRRTTTPTPRPSPKPSPSPSCSTAYNPVTGKCLT